eukprot:gnl/MRDRNA2_/MRDRNA2_110463_c0_seq1.p1 gnl/MRDRNA2_/MRDRNA2_110463_c0~~gnl/MRDRNA2_/MRDRNA2_110463_c0_seq1.p1  ORF type:complete len:285 (-),score=44.31 gnl/MRDRNA2_/MRDRNA2_110463_c0_seq1:61-915(-)
MLCAPCGSKKAAGPVCALCIPRENLFVSEPNPMMFGNDPNPRGNAEGWTNNNWLKSRFHFSFAEYSNGPSSFGCLRVMNDDLVQPNRGFGTHPHRDMEIITFVVDGELTHQDSMGTKETLERGSIQYMTAGTGIRHSEHNLHRTRPLRFIQSWVMPRNRGLAPNYGSMPGNEDAAAARKNKWAQLVSDVESSALTPVKINQDCNVFVTELDSGTGASALSLGAARQAYLLCVEGSITLGDQKQLRQHDAAELKGPSSLDVTAGSEGALLLVFEMRQTKDTRGEF